MESAAMRTSESQASQASGSLPEPRITLRGFIRGLVVFLILIAMMWITFSRTQDDALDTAFWTERGEITPMVEFRHLILRLLPLWTWNFLRDLGIAQRALTWLMIWDFVSSALLMMMVFALVKRCVRNSAIAFAGAFAFGTLQCIWIYSGSGRLYSTSMLLAVCAYFLAVSRDTIPSSQKRLIMSMFAAVFISFAGLFWLVHVFNAVGVGLLILFFPLNQRTSERLVNFALYSLAGVLLVLLVGASCLSWAGIPLQADAVSQWISSTQTAPLKYDILGIMKGSFGHAAGILVMNELPYMINGLMLKDSKLLQIGSFPWQLAKYVFVWAILGAIYLRSLWLLFRATPRVRLMVLAFATPLLITLAFAFGWLGTDVQRFAPAMPSLVVLGCLCAQQWSVGLNNPRRFAVIAWACLAFIAVDNLIESNLRSRVFLSGVAEQMAAIRSQTHPSDLMVNFGRDFPVTYQTMTRYYGGAISLTLTNDGVFYDWDSPRWRQEIHEYVEKHRAMGGRVFMMDRVVEGVNPVEAAWSEKQHAKPSVREFAQYLRSAYCVMPAFKVGPQAYFELRENPGSCPVGSLPPLEVPAR